ncbi:D-2-hydroxyacid dehydrogenase [Alcanivorax sp. JB21]|uniref:D-2-hydroxyacid dehydrogenase n=1 Tax=Alcanivorax limicola TaxID=2874102 RepID=UPI001CBDB1BA|nr:D-2-hydroxyacid dehydrogenase [Alcanivorax limicola]MBZ2189486.1 D-2-hydroxyacid dehydrogenase [Alcanivorax limicola]
MAKPVIAVLTAEDEDMLPGLEVGDTATLLHVRDATALRDALQRADILVVTDFRTGMLEDCWPENSPVRWVHATSAGVDALMIPPLKSSDIIITNARGVFDRGIAEYVLGAVLLFAKDTLENLRLQRARQWQHRETALIRDARALVVGAGSIGREVAHMLRAVGMQVTGTARSAREDPAFDKVCASEQLPTLLPGADYIVITAPLTADTQGLFDAGMLARCKTGAVLINVGRGPIVRSDALLDALDNGPLAGAALDVFEQEPLPKDHPLWQHPKVMISAHMAGDFHGWRRALAEQFLSNLARWQRNEDLFNQVDI